MLTITVMMLLITADFSPKGERREEVRGVGAGGGSMRKRVRREERRNRQHVIFASLSCCYSTDDQFFILQSRRTAVVERVQKESWEKGAEREQWGRGRGEADRKERTRGEGGEKWVRWVDVTVYERKSVTHCWLSPLPSQAQQPLTVIRQQWGVALFLMTEINLLVSDSSTMSAPPVSLEPSHQS